MFATKLEHTSAIFNIDKIVPKPIKLYCHELFQNTFVHMVLKQIHTSSPTMNHPFEDLQPHLASKTCNNPPKKATTTTTHHI